MAELDYQIALNKFIVIVMTILELHLECINTRQYSKMIIFLKIE